MITVSINKQYSTGEYVVTESKSREHYYTDDPVDAVQTAIAIVKNFQRKGHDAKLSSANYTKNLLARFRPD